MNLLLLTSQIWTKGFNELFDYSSQEKNIQTFSLNTSAFFYKNGFKLEKKYKESNAIINPIFSGNEFLVNIEKETYTKKNNQRITFYQFINKANFSSLRMDYRAYRKSAHIINIKEKEIPTWFYLPMINKKEVNKDKNLSSIKNTSENSKEGKYNLHVGDVIKLGRISLIVTKIRLSSPMVKDNSKLGKDENDNNKNGNGNVLINNYMKGEEQDKKSISDNKTVVNADIYAQFQSKRPIINSFHNKKKRKTKSIVNLDKLSQKEFTKNKALLSEFNLDELKSNNNETRVLFTSKKLILNMNDLPCKKSIKNEKNSVCQPLCRICYCTEEEGLNSDKEELKSISSSSKNFNKSIFKNHFINPCNCSGDVKYIHLFCLYKWLKTKIQKLSFSSENCKEIMINCLNCEICKERLPDIVHNKINNCCSQIFDIEKIDPSLSDQKTRFKNYIILESFEFVNNQKIFYIATFDKSDSISMGRSHDSDIRINDVTVSRQHAILKRINNNTIELQDCNSKFGTLILCQADKIKIDYNLLPIQIGKTFLQLQLYNEENLLCIKNFLCLKYIYNICKKLFKNNKADKARTNRTNSFKKSSRSHLSNSSNGEDLVNSNNNRDKINKDIIDNSKLFLAKKDSLNEDNAYENYFIDYMILNYKHINPENFLFIKEQVDEDDCISNCNNTSAMDNNNENNYNENKDNNNNNKNNNNDNNNESSNNKDNNNDNGTKIKSDKNVMDNPSPIINLFPEIFNYKSNISELGEEDKKYKETIIEDYYKSSHISNDFNIINKFNQDKIIDLDNIQQLNSQRINKKILIINDNNANLKMTV